MVADTVRKRRRPRARGVGRAPCVRMACGSPSRLCWTYGPRRRRRYAPATPSRPSAAAIGARTSPAPADGAGTDPGCVVGEALAWGVAVVGEGVVPPVAADVVAGTTDEAAGSNLKPNVSRTRCPSSEFA